MIYRAPRQALNSENLDDVKLYQHLVGSGKQVEVTEAFVGDKLDLLRRFLHGRGQEVMDSALERGEVSVHVFLRAKVDLNDSRVNPELLATTVRHLTSLDEDSESG